MNTVLSNLLSALPPHPISKSALDKLVSGIPGNAKGKGKHAEWEYLLKKEIFQLAVSTKDHLWALGGREFGTHA